MTDAITDQGSGALPDEMTRRREITRLVRSFVDRATVAVEEVSELHKMGLSTDEVLREIWRELPAEIAARVPQDLFTMHGSMMAVQFAALLHGPDAMEDLWRQITTQSSSLPPDLRLSLVSGIEQGMRIADGKMSQARGTRHHVQVAIRAALAGVANSDEQAGGPAGLSCRVILADGIALEGLLSETPEGGLRIHREPSEGFSGAIYDHFFDISDVRVFSRPRCRT